MNNLKRNSILFFTLLVFMISGVFTFQVKTSYATGKYINSNIYYKINKGSVSNTSTSSFKPNSGKFNSNISKPSGTYKSSKPNATKPDSGNFTTKPKSGDFINDGINENKPKSSTIKPDSGKFSTKPNTKSTYNSNSNNKKNYEYEDSPKKTIDIPPLNGRGFFGFERYNPFGYFGYKMGISPIITDTVVIITILIFIYIIIDYIRSRKNM